jgi:hypothetical protein
MSGIQLEHIWVASQGEGLAFFGGTSSGYNPCSVWLDSRVVAKGFWP